MRSTGFTRCAAGIVMFLAAPMLHAAEFRIDCSAVTGTLRPLHGVNNGPLNQGETLDLSKQWKALSIPWTRLHDSEWPHPDIVDMTAVFPDPKADPQRAESYRFARTDDYIKPIIEAGSGIVYRLGESIEHSPRKHRVHPPADPHRWALACLGIIRHYNENWASGFRYGIKYWEIWNEPENRPAMWTGSDEQYYALYAVAAAAIKKQFPTLKVGGPSAGHIGDVADGVLKPSMFLAGFIEQCRDRKLPLDFFSWHTYSNDPSHYALKAKAIRRWLDDHGFKQTEIHLNEWNYLPDNDWSPMLAQSQGEKREQWYARMGGAEGAAFVASVLIRLQDSPVDVANLYSGDSSPFGLFTRHGAAKKSYHAVRAFNLLLTTPRRISVTGEVAGSLVIVAGIDKEDTRLTILVSHTRAAEDEIVLNLANLRAGARRWKAFLLDDKHDLAPAGEGTLKPGDARLAHKLPAPGVLLIQVE